MKKKIIKKKKNERIRGTKDKPRLSVFRSNKHLFLQLIDDASGKTLVSAKDENPSAGGRRTKTEIARESGKKLAESAVAKKIKKVVFDRGKYKYHGRVKAAAEGAREGGLIF